MPGCKFAIRTASSASVKARGMVLALYASNRRMRCSMDAMASSCTFRVVHCDREGTATPQNLSQYCVVKGRAASLQRLDVCVQLLIGALRGFGAGSAGEVAAKFQGVG